MHTRPVVWFFDPRKTPYDFSNAMNKLVAQCDPPYCHTEIQFASGEAFSIVVAGQVRKKNRSFDQAYYHGFVLNCSKEQCDRAWQVACEEFESQKQFGIWNANTTFCSKLVATILHKSGICCVDNDHELNTITPSRLFANIRMCSSPLTINTLQAIDFKTDLRDLQA